MHAYCVDQCGFTEHAAYKRIAAARAARDFPAIFDAVADGRLHLSAVVVLAPHLVPETADELIRSAAYQTKSEIERLIAARHSTGHGQQLDSSASLPLDGVPEAIASAAAPEELAPGRVETRIQPPETKSPPAGPVVRRLAITQLTRDKMRYAVALMSHQRGSRDDVELVDRAFDALIEKLEKQKFASRGVCAVASRAGRAAVGTFPPRSGAGFSSATVAGARS